jgi:hypothetical protein
MQAYLYDEICKITNRQITVIIDIRTRLQCGHIFMMRYAKSYTHIDLARRSSILLACRRSCCTWSLNKLHPCWWLRELIPGLQWDHKTFWTCTFGLQEHSASVGRKHRKNNDHWTKDEELFILKIMIIGHKMKLFILMPGGSELPSSDMAASKGYVTRILLVAVFEGWATQSPPITRILLATERSRRRRKRRKKGKACALQDLFFVP